LSVDAVAPRRALVVVCAIVMLVGASLRFVGLASKVFGNDEATTSMHVSGHTLAQFADDTFDGKARTAEQLLAYQRPDPAHGPRDVIASLAIEDPQHPPLYYLIERQWELGAGSSIAARRALSAVYGVIAIGAAVWLGVELWSFSAGIIMGALVAASPFAIAYAQVAREYSLWLALTFASTAIFVRAVRTRRTGWWAAYTVCAVAGLYTDALFALVVVAHALAAAFVEPKDVRSSLTRFGIAALVAVIAYAPWIAALRAGYGHGVVTNNAYLGAGLPLKLFALKWIFNIGTLFYDADYVWPKSVVLALPGFAVLLASAIACARVLKKQTSLCVVFSLAFVTALALVVPDILHHEQRSTASRYCVPLWAGAYAAVGVGLAIAYASRRRVLRAGALAFVLLTAATGFGSFAVSEKHASWWVDGSAALIVPLAAAIEHAHDPLVIWHATWGPGAAQPQWDFTPMMLADADPAHARFAIFRGDRTVTVPTIPGDIFVLEPSDDLLTKLRTYGLKPTLIATGTVASANAQVKALQSEARTQRANDDVRSSSGATLWKLSR
jgi:uncharacterized membrane protein